MDKEKKENLEQELNFLKESYESEVITKEEFEKGKDRIESKLKEFGSPEEKNKVEEAKVEGKDKAEEKNNPEEKETKTDKKKRRKALFWLIAIFIILAILSGIFYSLMINETQNIDQNIENIDFNEVDYVNYAIISGKECVSCDTSRVEKILKNWFPNIMPEEIDYSGEQGSKLAEELGIDVLPAYIFTEEITEFDKFAGLKNLFMERNGYYILNREVSAANFHFKREKVNGKLDLFIKAEDKNSMIAEKNSGEFAKNSGVEINVHDIVSELASEVGIKTAPTFLINNIVELRGVHSQDTLKEEFCKYNKNEVCSKILQKSLVK